MTFLRFSDVFLGGSSHVSDPKQLLCNVDYQFVALTQCIGSLFYWSYVLLDEALEICLFAQFHGALM